jgi:hypothetical protein
MQAKRSRRVPLDHPFFGGYRSTLRSRIAKSHIWEACSQSSCMVFLNLAGCVVPSEGVAPTATIFDLLKLTTAALDICYMRDRCQMIV